MEEKTTTRYPDVPTMAGIARRHTSHKLAALVESYNKGLMSDGVVTMIFSDIYQVLRGVRKDLIAVAQEKTIE